MDFEAFTHWALEAALVKGEEELEIRRNREPVDYTVLLNEDERAISE